MAERVGITVFRGEDVIQPFVMNDATMSASIFRSFTVKLTVRQKADDADPPLLQVTAVMDSIRDYRYSFTFTSAQLAALLGDYVFDVQITDVGSVAVLAIGSFEVLQEVRIP